VASPSLVWYQLDLFLYRPVDSGRLVPVQDSERDRRSGGQWLRAILSYLEFGAGDAWRRLSDPEQRNSPERLWYLGGIRTINGIETCQPVISQPATFTESPTTNTTVDARLSTLAGEPRLCLVDRLMAADHSLTDKKILLHLSRPKLAQMLCRAWDAQPLVPERAA